MERRAATRTRAERKMAAVREEAAMEGRLRARVMPRVSRAELPNVIFVPREFSKKKTTGLSQRCLTFDNSEQRQGKHTGREAQEASKRQGRFGCLYWLR